MSDSNSVSNREVIQVPGGSLVIAWKGILTGNRGAVVDVSQYEDLSIQFFGMFGDGASIRLEGSNDGENFVTLSDPQGNSLVKIADSIEAVVERTRYIRPAVDGGNSDTKLNAYLFMKARR